MYIGGSLFLLAIGAILAFAVQDAVNGIDLVTTGYILMGVGVLGLVLSLILAGRAGRDAPPPR
ncbi:hypothetical protein JL108_18935 [Aeromicrobium sp. YIM 150415]|uniref:DUF6458 domain-containing protein n=1 Tax=Aeromicrobium piscarium TaxID=2590901 RepID=A0A554SFI7_9ACTN|nr:MULTISPECIES: DUF6458 family protein [Aeromicrobium]MBM9465530.1 hypothetical protein [Aeromicrobium sp. YIM 150415]TSD65117.1 hypothetical protein FNM00_05260 [Aeromicrobium piscarium]